MPILPIVTTGIGRRLLAMILVTGATGTIGSHAVHLLVRDGHEVRAMGRDPDRLDALPDRAGFETAVGNLEDADSVRQAVKGVDAVLLIAPGGATVPRHDGTVVAAARAEGVDRIVKVSTIAADREDWPVPHWHRTGEDAVRASGVAWTMLRPSTFASNTLGWAQAVRDGAPVPNPFGDGRQGVVDPRDIAAVAAAVLTTPGHAGRTYTLTGPELISVPEQAAILSEVLGTEVTLVSAPVEAIGESLRTAGADEAYAATAEHGARLVLRGDNAVLTSDVAEVLGRPAGTFADWARDHRAAFG